MSKWDRYPSNAGVHPPQRYKYPTDRALRDAVDRFRAEWPTLAAGFISVTRRGNETLHLQVEIANDVVAFLWDTGRAKYSAGLLQAEKLEQLLTARGITVHKSRPW